MFPEICMAVELGIERNKRSLEKNYLRIIRRFIIYTLFQIMRSSPQSSAGKVSRLQKT
jgi:hypothetical protein